MPKITLSILLLVILTNASAQKWYKPFISKNDAVILPVQFIAGAADGLHEVLVNHIHTFERDYPQANMNWWNPKLSQNNKYHTLTVISDGYHVTRTIEHSMNYFSIAFSSLECNKYSKKQVPLLIIKKMLLSILVNRIAFRIVYDGIFHT